jgi:ParB-like chromosome segregation protein Spo0J
MRAAMMKVSNVGVGERFRKDAGDIPGLAESIADIGLLQPIVVRPDGMLIAGARRLAAYKLLGRDEIPVNVVDIGKLVFGERAENIDRKDFTIEERVAIGEECERLLGERRGRPGKKGENFPPLEQGTTRDIAAKKAGFKNGRTYEQAKVVINAAKAEPDKFTKVKEEMNRSGRVNGSFRRVKVARQAAAIVRAAAATGPRAVPRHRRRSALALREPRERPFA